jgi:hypothetical protein
LRSELVLPAGDALELCFELPRLGPISVRGQVARAEFGEHSGMGIRFCDVDKNTRRQLRLFAE